MKILKKSFTLLIAILLFSAFISSCASSHQVGCPGQDRPSFKARHGMTTPANKEFNALPTEKKSTTPYNINTLT